jgi:hypothetical protein
LQPVLINKEMRERLKCGEIVIVDDDTTGESYLIHLDRNKVGLDNFTERDLEIDLVSIEDKSRYQNRKLSKALND